MTVGDIRDHPNNDPLDSLSEDRRDRQTAVRSDAPKTGKPDPRQTAIKSLLESAGGSIGDKLATVKTAHLVDKDRFQSAFRSLMTSTKP